MRAIIEDENADDGVKLRVSFGMVTIVHALHFCVLVLTLMFSFAVILPETQCHQQEREKWFCI
jgi:hypothetical protein